MQVRSKSFKLKCKSWLRQASRNSSQGILVLEKNSLVYNALKIGPEIAIINLNESTFRKDLKKENCQRYVRYERKIFIERWKSLERWRNCKTCQETVWKARKNSKKTTIKTILYLVSWQLISFVSFYFHPDSFGGQFWVRIIIPIKLAILLQTVCPRLSK